MADSNNPPPTLTKIRSLPLDIHRNKEWEKLKNNQRLRLLNRSKSLNSTSSEYDVSDDDIKELKACFDLGFGFDLSNELDPKLKQAFPALELYAAVNRNLSRSSSSDSSDSSSFIFDTKDDPKMLKMRLKRWAQVVACSIHGVCTQRKTKVAESKSMD